MWCVGELGLPYQRLDVGYTYGGNGTPEFLAMNPNATVPVIRDDDEQPVWETGAILRYLCARYAADPFWPTDLAARTNIDIWAEWSKLNIALNFTVPIFWRVVRTAPANQDSSAIRSAISSFTKKLDIAEERLGSRLFIAGDEFSLADIQFGHVLYRYFNISIDRPKHPAIQRYFERLAARPAFVEHVMISYDELRVD